MYRERREFGNEAEEAFKCYSKERREIREEFHEERREDCERREDRREDCDEGKEKLIPAYEEKFCEEAYVIAHERPERFVRYKAKNTVIRSPRREKMFLDYSSIDRGLQNERVVSTERYKT